MEEAIQVRGLVVSVLGRQLVVKRLYLPVIGGHGPYHGLPRTHKVLVEAWLGSRGPGHQAGSGWPDAASFARYLANIQKHINAFRKFRLSTLLGLLRECLLFEGIKERTRNNDPTKKAAGHSWLWSNDNAFFLQYQR